MVKRKTRVKRRKKKSPIVNLSAGAGTGLAPKAKITFAQMYEGQMTAVADDYDYLTLNSCYDMGQSLFSSQPPYFDSLLASGGPYLRYRVTSANVKATFVNQSDDTVRVFMYITDSLVDLSSISSFNLSNSRLIASEILTPAGGSKDRWKINRHYDFASLFGKQVLTDDEFQAGYNANPTDQIYLVVGVQPLDGSSTTNCWWSVECRQYTQLESHQTYSSALDN